MKLFFVASCIGVISALTYDRNEYLVDFGGENTKEVIVIVTNDESEVIDLAISFNQTLPDDGNPLTTSPVHSDSRLLSSMNPEDVASSLLKGVGDLHQLEMSVDNTKEELIAVRDEIIQCLKEHRDDCGIRRRPNSNLCYPKVQVLLHAGIIRLSYDETVNNCQQEDLAADLTYCASRLKVLSYQVETETENTEDEPVLDVSGDLETHGRRLSASVPVNDPEWNKEWHMEAQRIPEAWALLKYTPENFHPIVGIIAAGFDLEHPDIKANYWVNEAELNGLPGVDDDGNGYVDDILGWSAGNGGTYYPPSESAGVGTHMAGIIGAVVNNSIGVAGYGNNIKVALCKRISQTGSGSWANGNECYDWGISIGAHIMVNAYGYGYDYVHERPANRQTYERMNEAGVLAITKTDSAGLSFNDKYFLDACLNTPNQLSVAASTSSGEIAAHSAYGDRCIELASPGVGIYSAYEGSTYKAVTTAAQAVSTLAGATALILNANPYLDALELKRIIRNSIVAHPSMARPKTLYGGVLSPVDAIKLTRPTNVRPSCGAEWDQLRFNTIRLKPCESMIYKFIVDKGSDWNLGQFVAYSVDVKNNYKVKGKSTADLRIVG